MSRARVVNPLVVHAAVALVLLNSGAVYFQQVYLQEMTFALLALAVVFFGTTFMPFPVALTLLGLAAATLANYAVFQQNFDGYVALLMRVVAVAFIALNVEIGRLAEVALNIICLFALSSVPFWLFGVLFPGRVRELVPLTEVYTDSLFRLTPLYSYGPYNFERNTGMFWEPGAHQVYLNVGLALALLVPGIAWRKAKVILLLVVLATTLSTAGYLLLPIWFACLALSRRRGGSTVILGTLGSVGAGYVVAHSATVATKFEAGNASYDRRVLDTTTTFDLMLEKPWTGWGFQNIDILRTTYGAENTSNSLLGVGYQFGVIGLIGILLVNAYSFHRLGLRATQVCLLMVAYVAIMGTENFIFSPMFLLMIFAAMATTSRPVAGFGQARSTQDQVEVGERTAAPTPGASRVRVR